MNSTPMKNHGGNSDGSVKASRRERPVLPELPLRRAIPYSIAGQVAYILCQMGVLSALAHFRGAAAVGEFGLALALTTPAFMFVNMGGRNSQASDVTHRYSFAEYASLVISAAMLATIVSITAGYLLATASVFLIVVIVALTKGVESISNLSYGAFQQAGRMDKVAISMTMRGIFTVGLFVLFLSLGASTAVAFLAQLSVWTALAFVRDYPLGSRIATGRIVWPSLEWRRIFQLVRETAPLGASHVVNSLLVSLPRLVVERSLGLSAVGLLTVANYFQQAGALLINAFSQALVNRFARLRSSNSHHDLRSTIKALLVFATIASVLGLVVASVASEWVLITVFGQEFAAAEGLIVLVAVALCARLFAIVPQSILHAERRYKDFLWREIAAVSVCVIFLAICVPIWGLMGAGYAIVAAAIARLLLMYAATARWRKRADDGAANAAEIEPETLS